MQGCSLEESLLANLHYDDDLTASQTATVFKYANNAQLFYNCQIRVTLKELDSACPVGSRCGLLPIMILSATELFRYTWGVAVAKVLVERVEMWQNTCRKRADADDDTTVTDIAVFANDMHVGDIGMELNGGWTRIACQHPLSQMYRAACGRTSKRKQAIIFV